MQPAQIFISYSRTNSNFVVQLVKDLKAAGYNVWLDQLDIPAGMRWDNELEKALERCEIFMVILTPSSAASENVKDEIGYAIDAGKRIVPVLLENAILPLRLRRFQYVNFTSKSYEDGLESAKQLLGSLIEKPASPGAETPPVQNVEVERKAMEKSALFAAQQIRAGARRKAKVEPMPPDAPTQKKPASRGLVIGIAIVLVLAIAGIGIYALRGPAGAVPTQAPAIDRPASISGPSIIGLWERRSSKMTERFNLQEDGSFTVEARNNETNEIIDSVSANFTYDENNIYYHNTNFTQKSESYYLDNGGDLLVIENQVDRAWTRVK